MRYALIAALLAALIASAPASASPSPKNVSRDTFAVFALSPSGEPDAAFYAQAFAQAVSDRLYCAPKCISQQVGLYDIGSQMCLDRISPAKALSDASGRKLGKELGVRWIVTGDLHLAQGEVSIKVVLTDLGAKSTAAPLKATATATIR